MSTEADGAGNGAGPAAEFGMWVFLTSEGLLFGGLILAYLGARFGHGTDFAAGSRQLSLPLGTVNTAVLLTSSFCAAMALIAADSKNERGARLLLAGTAVLGLAFLGIKGFEYWDEARKGLLPFVESELRYPTYGGPHQRLFFDAYLLLTGTHALHLMSGIVVVLSLAAFWRKLRDPGRTLSLVALYWHFIDVVWVFMFPLLYLVR